MREPLTPLQEAIVLKWKADGMTEAQILDALGICAFCGGSEDNCCPARPPECDHSDDAPDDVYWKWVSSDGYCMMCGELV